MKTIHPELLVGLALIGAVYFRAGFGRSERATARDATCFVAALLTFGVALNGPLHDLSEKYLFSAHMVQHLLLTLVASPLLLAGTPTFMIDGLMRPLFARRPTRALVVWATRPLPALALYALALFSWHLPGPYDAALQSHALHLVEHMTFVATAVLAWWPVLSRSHLAPPLPYAAQIMYLFVFGAPMTLVAAMVTAAETPLYSFYSAAPRLLGLTPLDDQRLGGVIMWVPAGLVPLLAFTAVFFRWAASEAEEPPVGAPDPRSVAP